jgi:hypothetical protein
VNIEIGTARPGSLSGMAVETASHKSLLGSILTALNVYIAFYAQQIIKSAGTPLGARDQSGLDLQQNATLIMAELTIY